MVNRRKVINGLKCCIPMTTRDGFADCKKCPYDRKITLDGGVTECCHDLMVDALTLLEAQEPRVMTLEEIVKWEGAFWLEFLEEGNDEYARYGYAFFSGSTPYAIEIIVRDSFRPLYAFIKCEYRVRWRCWTSRPDEKTMEEMPWN